MEKKTEFVPVRMTPTEVAVLKAVANERSCSVGSVLRWAVKTAVLKDSPDSRRKRSGERAQVSETAGATPLVIQP